MQTLIIGGTTKAATTSLYNYLAEHPQVLATYQKECYFWTDTDFNDIIPSQFDLSKNYNSCFPDPNNESIRLDVTPNYLYSLGTPMRIQRYLKEVQFVFSLREPISRLISWHGFGKQMGLINKNLSLDDYVDKMFETGKPKKYEVKQPYRSLYQGLYYSHLERYFNLFPNQVHIIFFDDIKSQPITVLKELADISKIDASFYDNYEFQVFNRTRTILNLKAERKYHSIRKRLASITGKRKIIHNSGRLLKEKFVEPFFYSLNGGLTDRKQVLSSEQEKRLLDFYRNDVEKLNELFELPQNWINRYEINRKS